MSGYICNITNMATKCDIIMNSNKNMIGICKKKKKKERKKLTAKQGILKGS